MTGKLWSGFSIGTLKWRDTDILLSEPIDIALRFVSILDSLKIKYFVGGSLASSLYGIPRSTNDVDLIADISLNHIPALINALRDKFYFDEETIRDAVKRRDSFSVIHLETILKIDVFIPEYTDTAKSEMSRRKLYTLSDAPAQTLFLSSAEDIIVQKLSWYNAGNRVSDRQWQDVIGVLKVQKGKLDETYLRETAQKMSISSLLEKAQKEV